MSLRLSKRVIGIIAAAIIIAVGGIATLPRVMHKDTPHVGITNAGSSSAPLVEPANNNPPSAQPAPAAVTPKPALTQQPTGSPNYSIDDPASIWVVVNKKRPLPSSYAPSDLISVGGKQMRSQAASAIKQLVSAATSDGLSLKYVSAYRSYSYQTTLYNNYVAADGQSKADTYSARPGHSEHQTGLAADIGNADGSCELDICFGQTVAGKWIDAHAYEYGFIVRYPADETAVTGYQYEPWHVRYVGTWLAKQLHNKPQTLEEYFGIGAAPDY